MTSRFQGGLKGSTYTCTVCHKITRETGHSESLVSQCAYCYEEGGLENSLTDGHIDQAEFDATLQELRRLHGRDLVTGKPKANVSLTEALQMPEIIAAVRASEGKPKFAGLKFCSLCGKFETEVKKGPVVDGYHASCKAAAIRSGRLIIKPDTPTQEQTMTDREYDEASIRQMLPPLTELQQKVMDALPAGREYSVPVLAKETGMSTEQTRRTVTRMVANGLLTKKGLHYRRAKEGK